MDYLANPMWSALSTAQAEFCVRVGDILRFPAAIAPFCAVTEAGVEVDPNALFEDGDLIFGGVIPKFVGSGYCIHEHIALTMMYTGKAEPVEALLNEVELTIANSAEMVELASATELGLFRPHSARLGRFIGLRVGSQLVAMAGERLRVPGLREISGVATRPGHTGRGYARHLIQRLLCWPGQPHPFLNVSNTNSRAIEVYQSLGFEIARELRLVMIAPE